MTKNILVLVGSPRVGGNTDRLADAFMEGAEKSGNAVRKMNVVQMNINYCIGCYHCIKNKGQCIQDDDMNEVYKAFKEADMVLFASPLYYWSFTAQLKTTLDRLYALGYHKGFESEKKDTALLMVAGSSETEVFSQIVSYYKFGFLHRLGWRDRGILLVGGVAKKGDLERTDGLARAYQFGQSIE